MVAAVTHGGDAAHEVGCSKVVSGKVGAEREDDIDLVGAVGQGLLATAMPVPARRTRT